MYSKVLVTGGAGFIGRWVVGSLLKNKIEVKIIDDLSNSSLENIKEFMGKVEFISGDIRDKKILEKAFDGVDACIHLAAKVNVQKSIEAPRETFETNVVGTLNILEEARKLKIKVVFVSSCFVYDLATGKPINEEHNLNAISPFATSKLIGEGLVEAYGEAYNMPTVIIRLFNTYGPFQKSTLDGGVIPIFISRKLSNETLQIMGKGEQKRDFLHVEDAADAIIEALLKKQAEGHILNIGSGKDISIKELALKITNDEKKVQFIKHHHPQSEIFKLVCDNEKAKRILNWRPKTSLEDGLKMIEEWMKSGKNEA